MYLQDPPVGSCNPTPVFVHPDIDESGVSPAGFRVYVHLSRVAGSAFVCSPSQQAIGDKCFPSVRKPGSRRKAAMRAIKELEDLGFIEKLFQGRGPRGSQPVEYRIVGASQYTNAVEDSSNV
jgi:hypothetical protein